MQNCKKRLLAVNVALAKSQQELQENAGLTRSVHNQFDTTCAMLRKCHKERREAVDYWKSTIDSLGNRDEEMNSVAQVRASLLVTFGITSVRYNFLCLMNAYRLT